MKFFSPLKEKAVEILNDFKDEPRYCLEEILTFLSVAAGAVGFLVALILYISGGGYFKAFNLIKSSGIQSAFTYGNVSILTSSALSLILNIALAALFVFLLVDYFWEHEKSKRIVMAIDLPFLIIGGVFTVALIYFAATPLDFDEATQLKIMSVTNGKYAGTLKIAAIVLVALFLIALGIFIALLIKAKPIRMIKNIFLCGALNLIALPLLLLLFENAVPLFALIIIGVIILIVVKVMASNSSSEDAPHEEDNDPENGRSEERGHVNWYLEDGTRVYVKNTGWGTPKLFAYRQNFTNTKYQREVPYPMSSITRPTLEEFKQGKISIFVGSTQLFPKDLYYKK